MLLHSELACKYNYHSDFLITSVRTIAFYWPRRATVPGQWQNILIVLQRSVHSQIFISHRAFQYLAVPYTFTTISFLSTETSHQPIWKEFQSGPLWEKIKIESPVPPHTWPTAPWKQKINSMANMGAHRDKPCSTILEHHRCYIPPSLVAHVIMDAIFMYSAFISFSFSLIPINYPKLPPKLMHRRHCNLICPYWVSCKHNGLWITLQWIFSQVFAVYLLR